MQTREFSQMLGLTGKSFYRRVKFVAMFLQVFYWKFLGQGFYVRNKSGFKEFGWSLTSKSVNWGDLLVRELAEGFFDVAIIKREYSGAVFGGSVLDESFFQDFQKNNSTKSVLSISCGARNSGSIVSPPPNLEIHGVRGHGTASLVKNAIPTGDPGMLAPVIFGIQPNVGVGFRKLHIPHFSQPISRSGSNHESFSTMLPFGKSSKSLVREINSSNFVLAGSLHAGICALATGTPFAFSLNESTEDPFKFHDFAQFYGINIVFQEDFESAIRWYVGEYSLHADRVPNDFVTYSGSLFKYTKYDLVKFRSKVEIHTELRNSIHALKVISLKKYLTDH